MTRQRLKPESQRQRRVGEEIRHALVHVLERGHFRDPDLQGVSITVTGVRMSPDLRHATVLVLPFGGGDAAALVKALKRAAGYLRGLLAHEIDLRHMPELVFEADVSFDRAAELDRLLHSPAVARDLAPHADGEAAEDPEARAADRKDKHGA
jgi:ribosome-binding factor A